MAITVLPREPKVDIAKQLSDEFFKHSQLAQRAEQFEEAKLSGASNRAAQVAVAEDAAARSALNRSKLKVLQSNPKAYQDLLFQDNKAMLNQVKLLETQITTQAKINALNTAKQTAASRVSQERSKATIQSITAASAQAIAEADKIIQASTARSAAFKAQDDARNARLAERTSALESVSGDAGKAAIFQAFDQNKTEAEMVEIGVAADASAAEKQSKSEVRSAAALSQLSKSKDAEAFQKRVAKSEKFGLETQKRRVSTSKNVGVPLLPTIDLTFDRDVRKGKGLFNLSDKGTFGVDYFEAKEMGKEKDWLKKYEKQNGEPYDVPAEPSKDVEGPVDDEGNAPPASIIKTRDSKFPGKDLVFQNGKWGIVK